MTEGLAAIKKLCHADYPRAFYTKRGCVWGFFPPHGPFNFMGRYDLCAAQSFISVKYMGVPSAAAKPHFE